MRPYPRLALIGLLALAVALACNLPAYTRAVGTPVRITATPAAQPTPSSNPASQAAQIFETAWEAVRDQYIRADYYGVDWNAVGDTYRAQLSNSMTEDELAQVIRNMLAELPEGQASYQTRAERLEAETTDTTRYFGIGAFVAFRTEPEPHVVILEVMDDSPAERAGLQAHDSIYVIDGEPVRASEAATVTERIRGAENTVVKLTIEGPDGKRRDLSITRGAIVASDNLRGGLIPDTTVAYYRVPVVAGNDMADLIAQNLQTVSANDTLSGVILDLRIAHSGQGWPLGPMLTLFGDGDLGEFYTRSATEAVQVSGQDIAASQTLPLVILIGPDTLGTPEIFAAALGASGRATLVGLPTPGDVEGFSEIPLPDGSRLFLATSSFRTADKTDLAKDGVQPHVTVNADWDQISRDDDLVLAAALELLK